MEAIKNRIWYGWNIRRVLFIVLGSAILIQSLGEHQWIGVMIGGYFTAMGIFSFGCAAGNCVAGECKCEPTQKSSTAINKIEHE